VKINNLNQRNHGLTLIDVLVIVLILIILAVVGLPMLAYHNRPLRIMCLNNLQQVGVSFKIWAMDHGGQFPMEVSATDGGTKGMGEGRATWINFLVMSNELSSSKILICPADEEHIATTNFGLGFNGANVSYFVGLDATTNQPKTLLSGDDNFEKNGTRIEPGTVASSTGDTINWTAKRHIHAGNVVFADASIFQLTSNGLKQALLETGLVTNRFAIP
jgi:competence protein ComGC